MSLKNKSLVFVLLFVICLTLFGYWQMSENFPDPDAFYHMKMAKLMASDGVVLDFDWQQYTILKEHYTDHHLLYHIILIPFVVWLPSLFGIKMAVVLLASLFIVVFALVLEKLKIKGAFWLSLLMALTAPLTFRLNLVKANSLALIILFLGLFCAYKYKYKWLFGFSLLYVWAYGGFVILFGVVGLIALIDVIKHRKFKRNILLIVTNLTGFAAGLVFNPYFSKNLWFYWQQVVEIGLINYQDKIGVGGEWYAYGLVELLTGCALLTVLLFVSLILFFVFIKKQTSLSWLGLALFVVGLALVLKSRRYIEYYVPFSVFFVATSLDVVFKKYWRREYLFYFFNLWKKNWINKLIIFVATVYVLLIVPVIVIRDQQRNHQDLKGGSNYYEFQAASNWLEKNSQAGAVVLHSDWDEWPQLFYHNHHNYYIVGLDPTFMYNYDQDLYWQWVDITIGKQKDDLPNIIKNKFKAKYVFIEKSHTDMDRNIRKFAEFSLVYEDDEVKIYKTKNLSP